MKEKRELIRKYFQVCVLVECSSSVVQKDEVVRRVLEKVQKELQQDIEDFDSEDQFADIVPEQDADAPDSTPLMITDAD